MEALSLSLQLQWEGSAVVTAPNGREGLARLFEREPDIVLLDVTMPGIDGWEVLRRIRSVSNVPVIMLTARCSEEHQVRGLSGGADDFITKPFGLLLLLARIKAVMRRVERTPSSGSVPVFRSGDLTIRSWTHEVTVGGTPVNLTPVEYEILEQLVRNAGRIVSRRALLDRVWGAEYGARLDYLKVFVNRLRGKIDHSGQSHVATERGIGYRFVPAGSEQVTTQARVTPMPTGP